MAEGEGEEWEGKGNEVVEGMVRDMVVGGKRGCLDLDEVGPGWVVVGLESVGEGDIRTKLGWEAWEGKGVCLGVGDWVMAGWGLTVGGVDWMGMGLEWEVMRGGWKVTGLVVVGLGRREAG